MGEMRQEVKVFTVSYLCDDCGMGVMESTGAVFLSNPPQYPCECKNCGSKKTFLKNYPHTEKEIIS